jgi:hypothetical protein
MDITKVQPVQSLIHIAKTASICLRSHKQRIEVVAKIQKFKNSNPSVKKEHPNRNTIYVFTHYSENTRDDQFII